MKELKKTISLSLDESVVEQMKIVAEQRDRSVSQCVNLILKQWLGDGSDLKSKTL